MPNVMATQLSISVTLCKSSVIPFLVPRRNVWLTSTAGVSCSDAANIGPRKTWDVKWILRLAKFHSPRKCIFGVAAQETVKHRAKFCWSPMSDVAAATKPRRESRWNLLGCRKLPNRSQPLVDQNTPYCEDMWRRYCCLTFSDCHHMPYLQTCSPTNLCDGAQMANFWRLFASRIFSEPCAAHVTPAF